MKFLHLIVTIISIFLLSYTTTLAAPSSLKNSYFASTDMVYGELYDNKIISEPVWKALLNQSHSLIYSMKVNPKYIYMAALEFGSDMNEILANQANVNNYDIKSIKDGYYTLTKEIYYNLYNKKYITNDEYDSQITQAWNDIYHAHSTPRKIYNTALDYQKTVISKIKSARR